MKLKYLSKIILSALIAAPAIMAWSCRDDFKLTGEKEIIEGLPANIHISLSIANMDIRTRSAGTLPEEAKEVKNLWVGIFDSNNNGVKINDLVIYSAEDVGEHIQNGKINIDLTAYSGSVYIVAVANAQGKQYYLPDDIPENEVGHKIEQKTDLLKVLEDDNLTWYDYQAIATALSNPRDITRQGTESFIMSGYYTEGGMENIGAGHPVEITPQTIIPGENKGVIHLRRLDAYNLFRIHVNEYIKFTPISWQVVNIPALSFVQERAKANNIAVNASDLYMGDVTFGGYSEIDGYSNKSTYHNSEVYEAQWFDKGTTDRIGDVYKEMYTFDFYLGENKHTGILDEDHLDYNYREWEFKDGEDNFTLDKDGNKIYENVPLNNTGWYRSLVNAKPTGTETTPSKWNERDNLWNNNATYIVLHAKMEYYYAINDANKAPVAESIAENNRSAYISRTADVTYTIHLGYCEEKEEDGKVNDFNCKRNTQYTYNVLINGADNIRVEANSSQADGENFQHGMEGMVTDQFDAKTIHLDSHYGVFNIQLTDDERRTMEWAIETPFGNNSYRFYYNRSNNTVTINNTQLDLDNQLISKLTENQFYNWIQIRPTTGENILAAYTGDPRLKGKVQGSNNIRDWARDDYKDGMWSLVQLADPTNYPHPYNTVTGDDVKRPYTIFIDEYVYENGELNSDFSSTNANIESNWYNFVNIDDRKFWLYYVKGPHISIDGKNIYNEADFEMTQESIQSYYSSDRVRLTQESGKNIGIFGVESLNESYIKNRDYQAGSVDWDKDNLDGLYNTYRYTFENSIEWENVFTGNTLRVGNEDNADGNPKTFYIPEHDDYFMNACLARNRDLNNDGNIDVNEIRWYLPTDRTYTRMILGTNSLRSPLFDAKSMDKTSIRPGSGTAYSHYVASNKRQTWAEELAATGGMGSSGNLRCIRNLGLRTDVTPVKNPDQNSAEGYKTPTPAFIHDSDKHTIEMYYFRSAALRSYTSGSLNPHSIIDKNAFASRKFQYASDYCRPGVNLVSGYTNNNDYALLDGYNEIAISNFRDQYDSSGNRIPVDQHKWSASLRENSICKFYHDQPNDLSDVGQWRVPNITELGLIFLNDVLNKFDGLHYYISSSYEYFIQTDSYRGNYYMGIGQSEENITAFLGAARVICVKDIQTNY